MQFQRLTPDDARMLQTGWGCSFGGTVACGLTGPGMGKGLGVEEEGARLGPGAAAFVLRVRAAGDIPWRGAGHSGSCLLALSRAPYLSLPQALGWHLDHLGVLLSCWSSVGRCGLGPGEPFSRPGQCVRTIVA